MTQGKQHEPSKKVAVFVRVPENISRDIDMECARIGWSKQRFMEEAAVRFLAYTSRKVKSRGENS